MTSTNGDTANSPTQIPILPIAMNTSLVNWACYLLTICHYSNNLLVPKNLLSILLLLAIHIAYKYKNMTQHDSIIIQKVQKLLTLIYFN